MRSLDEVVWSGDPTTLHRSGRVPHVSGDPRRRPWKRTKQRLRSRGEWRSMCLGQRRATWRFPLLSQLYGRETRPYNCAAPGCVRQDKTESCKLRTGNRSEKGNQEGYPFQVVAAIALAVLGANLFTNIMLLRSID
jgi:hypothetical protein